MNNALFSLTFLLSLLAGGVAQAAPAQKGRTITENIAPPPVYFNEDGSTFSPVLSRGGVGSWAGDIPAPLMHHPSTPTFDDVNNVDWVGGFPIPSETFSSGEEGQTKTLLVYPGEIGSLRDLEANDFVDTFESLDPETPAKIYYEFDLSANWCEEKDLGTGLCEHRFYGSVYPLLLDAQNKKVERLSDARNRASDRAATYLEDKLVLQGINAVLSKENRLEKERAEKFLHWNRGLILLLISAGAFIGYGYWKRRNDPIAPSASKYVHSCHEHDKTQQS